VAMTSVENKQADIDRIWRQYVRHREPETRNRLVEHYLPVVRYHAERLKAGLPGLVDLNDLLSAGTVGLIEAITKFDPRRNVKFETFCSQRVRGAMFDDLRRADWVPRQVRSRAQHLAERRDALTARLERTPTQEEMAEELGLDVGEYKDLAEALCIKDQISIEGCQVESSRYTRTLRMDLAADTKTRHPLSEMQRHELRQAAVRGLSDKEKQVLIMYYYDELTMKEIGDVLGISESRVCQIHTQLLKFLRRKFEDLGLDGPIETE
jgi:RNA polymerase sigma factor for flagellar operon FliA